MDSETLCYASEHLDLMEGLNYMEYNDVFLNGDEENDLDGRTVLRSTR